MNAENGNKMGYNPQPPVLRQIAAFLFGMVFAFTGGYHGLELLLAAMGAPLLFAGAIRLYTAVYRFFYTFFPSGIIAAIAGFCAIGIVISFVLLPVFKYSTVLGGILAVALMLCEVFVFIRDVKRLKNQYNA